MVLGVEINEDISLVPQSQILGCHDPDSKSISGQDSSLMSEKPAVALNGEIGGQSSDIPRTKKLNLRNGSQDGDIHPCHVRSDGSIATQQSMESTAPARHKVFNYLNPSLIALVAVKYQAKFKDPFEANPAASWSCVAAIVMHSQIPLILRDFQSLHTKFLSFLNRVASASGVVSFLSLISLLLPQLPGLILLYTSCALFVIISGWPTLQSTCNWLFTKIKIVTDVVISSAS